VTPGLAALALAAAAPLPLAEIVARNTEARGGRAALEAVQRLEYDLRIVEPTFSAEVVYRVDRQGRMRIDVSVGGRRVFSEGYDGTRGWQWAGDAPHATEASAAGTAALRHGPQLPGHILGLHELAARGHRLESAGVERLDGVDYQVLKLTLDDGFVTHYYLDPRTWLVVRGRDHKAFHPDVDPARKWLETRHSDFRTVGGVVKAYKTENVDLATGQVVGTTTVTAVRVNPGFEPGLFGPP
jgi:hypothetical protein